MTSQSKFNPAKLTASRRSMLLGSGALLATGMAATLCPSVSVAAADATADRFMRMSGLLINHALNPDVGARMARAAAAQHPNMANMLDAIIAIAEKKNASSVEDFFSDIPDGELKDFAHWVIFAWYTGSSSEKRDATVFTYEEALNYKTTSDVVAIPSFGLSGPDLWSQRTVAISDIPRF